MKKSVTVEGTDLGERIAHMRIKRGISQIGLAKAVGVSATAINKIEAGETRMVRADHLLRIALEVGADPFALVFGENSDEYRFYFPRLETQKALFATLRGDQKRLLARLIQAFYDEVAAERRRDKRRTEG
ncbi:transcriptional regulator with XRE-family HTH domain [Paraburkholderia atlantica]|uniref:helix-turn-helix domain-containing protein n=1 Tax=Paraburkholderia atlantica TaxID=2654982 RepID=UPI003D252F16